jgi:hypothetical protein
MGHSRDRAPGERRRGGLDRREAGESRRRPPAADRVLALQRSAGNQAVSALLARSPDATKRKDDEKGAAAAGARATLSGIGTIPLLSVNFGVTRAPTGRGEEGKAPTPQEIVFSSKVGEHSTKLNKAVLDGQPMEVEVILPAGGSTLRLKLKGAIVSSYSTSGGEGSATETWALNVQSLEHTREGEPGE